MLDISTGLSGCKLKLIRNNSNLILRKYSSGVGYNGRLLAQCKKQLLFSKLILKNIDTPRIYKVNDCRLSYFDMEYISGQHFYDYFITSTIFDIDFVIQSLFEYLNFVSSNFKYTNIQNQVLDKLFSLKNSTVYSDYISFLISYVRNIDLKVPKTFCHGDLTFANIIFHKNRLFFIDFLDSYIDSFYCDLIKLKQELYYLWNLKLQNRASLRMNQIYTKIWKEINNKYSKFIETTEFEILDVINILRLEPYLTNDRQKNILKDILMSTKLYEKFNNANGREVFQIS